MLDCVEDLSFFYGKLLAQRLLSRRYLSLDAERSLLETLGLQAHPKFTLCMRMIQDMVLSDQVFNGFKVTVIVGSCSHRRVCFSAAV